MLTNSAIVFGNEEMKQSGRNKATIKGSFKAFRAKGRAAVSDTNVTEQTSEGEETESLTVWDICQEVSMFARFICSSFCFIQRGQLVPQDKSYFKSILFCKQPYLLYKKYYEI